jgi:hypothetical protein
LTKPETKQVELSRCYFHRDCSPLPAMIVRLLLLPFVVSLLLQASDFFSQNTNAEDPVFKQINSIVQTLSDITGLQEKHSVPYGRMSQAQLRKFLAHRIKKTLKPKELYLDELTLKLLGLVPEDYDLRKSTVDLLTEQAAAFYDYQEKRLFLLDVSSFASEETTLAHELAHALADQHFHLDKFVDNDSDDDDKSLAHTAVVEGQASWLMLAFQRHLENLGDVPSAEQLSTMESAGETSTGEYPVLQGSPLYIQQSLLFPYTEGVRFFDEVYRKRGKAAFSEVFSDGPEDTAQIYHPNLYFEHVKPTKPKPPKPSFAGGDSELTNGELGEFDHRMLIWQAAGKSMAAKLSPHALGGEYRIVGTGKKRKHPVLEYVSEWDSEQSAADYFTVYAKALRKKWQRCNLTRQDNQMIAGSSDTGYFVLQRTGRLVASVEGIENEEDWQHWLSH